MDFALDNRRMTGISCIGAFLRRVARSRRRSDQPPAQCAAAAALPPPVLRADITVCRQEFALQAALIMHLPCVAAVWGPSGCGKTTLLRAIAGLDPLARGFVSVNGTVWCDTACNFRRALHKRRVGYVFQEAELFAHLPVKGNLLYGYDRSPYRPRRFTFEHIASLLGLNDLLSRRSSALSGGQKQRVAIGRALLSQPEILLLDEPVSALDSSSRLGILELLSEIKSRFSIPMLYVTHHIDEVARLADRVCIMENGRIVGEGPKVVMMRQMYQRVMEQGHQVHNCDSMHLFHEGRDCPYELMNT